MDAIKKLEENEAFLAEWQYRKMLVRCESKGYKDCDARENALTTLMKLLEIILNYSA